MTQHNSAGTNANGKAIGPTQTQYDTLQGKFPNVKGSGFNGIDAGAETAETRDIFILPSISKTFKSVLVYPNVTGEYWYFRLGDIDSTDIFLIDSNVDITKVAQFANCIWHAQNWKGTPLLDTRYKEEGDDWGKYLGEDSFEMASYSDWDTPAPVPSQFGTIDLSKINLNYFQGMSDDDFIETYKSYIKAYVPGSQLDKDTFNPSTPTYSINPSATSINEGGVLTTTVATTNVKSGTKLYYSIGGNGINLSDFSQGNLTGAGKVGKNNTFSLSHTLKKDNLTEGTETIEIKLYSDAGRTNQVGSTTNVRVAETSSAPVTSYTITPSVTSINEGDVLGTTVATTNVKSGTKLYYSIGGNGINLSDFSQGKLTGVGKVGKNNTFSLSHTLKKDNLTEGTETIEIKLYSDAGRTVQVGSTTNVRVADTSAPYIINPSATNINEGETLNTIVSASNVATGTTLYYSLSGTGVNTSDFSQGILTGEGVTDATGKFTFSHTLANDERTEGGETLEIKLYSDAGRTIQVGSTATVNVVDTSVYDFKTLFWNNLALESLFSKHIDIDTSKTTDALFGDYLSLEKSNNIVEIIPNSKSAIKYSQNYEFIEYDPDLYDGGGNEIVDLELFPDSHIRVKVNSPEDRMLWVGSSDAFTRLENSFNEGVVQHDGKSYEYITLINEINLISNTGLKTISRKEAELLEDKLFYAETGVEEKLESNIRRSFKVRQFNDIDIWLKDGLFVVDTFETIYNNYETPAFASYSKSFLLTLNGVHLGSFEEDYEYKYDPEDEQYRSVEFGLHLYEPNSYDKNITDTVLGIFPEEFAALSKAEGTAPIFAGYEGTQLGFDWLTSLPTSLETYGKEAVSLLGADSAIFGINQVYLALEDCDIVTGAGKDLIILADDINNSEGTVPRIHDFEVGQDKILIPAEVFAGFGNSPAGKLANSAFTSGVTSGNANHRVIYDTANGNLYHDSDGTGTEIQQLIATFTNKPILSAEDLLLG